MCGGVVVILLVIVASLAGVLSYGHDQYLTHVTPRGETIQVQNAGIYRFSVKALVVSGIPWDFVRLLCMPPLLVVALVLHARGSLRGSMLLLGALASLFYQYLLWTCDWAYNSMFLVYVALFSVSLCTGILILSQLDLSSVSRVVTRRFPVRTAAVVSFILAGVLLFKCLGEIVPGIGTGALPSSARGYYTLVDQGLDLGLLVPFCTAVGILLLRQRPIGFVLSASSLIVFLTIGLSVVAGEAMLGLSTGEMNVGGILVFCFLLLATLWLLFRILASIEPLRAE
jgi:hypothetical protein